MANPIDEVPDGTIALPGEGYVAPSVIQKQLRAIEGLDQAKAKRLLLAVQTHAEKAASTGEWLAGLKDIFTTILGAVAMFRG